MKLTHYLITDYFDSEPPDGQVRRQALVNERSFALRRTLRLPSLLWLVLLCPLICAAQTESKCFASEWLQGERSVNLTLTGSKVTGTFVVESGEDSSAQSYSFSGTRRGSVLTVVFADGKLPDITPSEIKSLVWTLIKNGKLLRIKVFGKNYETNKYENSSAYFRRKPCEPKTK